MKTRNDMDVILYNMTSISMFTIECGVRETRNAVPAWSWQLRGQSSFQYPHSSIRKCMMMIRVMMMMMMTLLDGDDAAAFGFVFVGVSAERDLATCS